MLTQILLSLGLMLGSFDAVCKVHIDNGGTGSGCVFEHSQDTIFIITNAHVIEGHNGTAKCTFWKDGHESIPIDARVNAESKEIDTACLSIPAKSFGSCLPEVIPFARRGTKVPEYTTIESIGCANGSWATRWRGHITGYTEDGRYTFLPVPANGRSGSAIIHNNQIVGIIQARRNDNSAGIAIPIDLVYQTFVVYNGKMHVNTGVDLQLPGVDLQVGPGCGPGGCPPYRRNYVLPYRQRHSGPYPTLPQIDIEIPSPGPQINVGPEPPPLPPPVPVSEGLPPVGWVAVIGIALVLGVGIFYGVLKN